MDKGYPWARVKMKPSAAFLTLALLVVAAVSDVSVALTVETCPSICHCNIRQLSINCSDKGLQRIRVLIPETTESLVLDGNNIDMIPDFAFHDLSRLRYLSIQRNRIVKIGRNAFHNLRNLESLHLGQNLLTDVNNLDLQDLKSLKVLDLHGNRIKRLPEHAVRSLVALETLNVSANEIQSASLHGGFEQTFNLKTVDFSRNNITVVRKNDFDVTIWWSNAKTLHLNLSHCHVRHIEPESFSRLYHLTSLSLAGNDEIPRDELHAVLADVEVSEIKSLRMSEMGITNAHRLIQGLQISTLDTLDLSNNNIEFLQQNTFLGFPRLTRLYLNGNNLTVLPSVFIGIGRMKRLNLANNFIKQVHGTTFTNLDQLENIDLSHNSLTDISGEIFHNQRHLTAIFLNNNRLTSISLSAPLEGVKTFAASNNKLSNISVINNLPNVETFDVSGNVIRDISAQSFPQTSKVKCANFSRNAIRTIDGAFVQYSPPKLDLSVNHLLHVRRVGWKGLKWLSLRHNYISNIENNTFQKSSQMEYLDLSFNWINSLNGSITHARMLKTLHLGKTPLREYLESPGLTEFQDLTRLEELSLDSIGLHVLNGRLLEATVRLTHLDISHNRIEHLNKDVFNREGQLRYINISHNNLHTLNVDMFIGLHRLGVLDLRHNPFQCTCELLHFIKWVHHSNISIVNINDVNVYKCHWPEAWTDVPLTELHFRMDSCMDSADRTIVYVALGFLLVLAILALILMCYFIRCCVRPRPRRDSYCELTDDNNDDDNAWV